MRRALVLGGVLGALATGLAPAPAAAQTEFGIDVGAFSSYVWRGITLTSKPVLQPDLWLSFPIGGASLTFGGWASVDIGSYDGSDDIAEGGGSSFNLAEFDPYAEIGYTLGKAELTWGVTGYIYPNDAGLTSDINTWEVYGKVGLDAPLSPSIAAYYDIDKVKGLYVEGSLAHGLPLGASTLNLTALAGLSAGQHCSGGDALLGTCDHAANFQGNGLTHLDFSAGIDFEAGALTISPVFHLQVSQDELTKINNGSDTDEDFKIWGGVTVSWSRLFGGSSEE
jgi:uncharacterized protein (TIGR02001 family)